MASISNNFSFFESPQTLIIYLPLILKILLLNPAFISSILSISPNISLLALAIVLASSKRCSIKFSLTSNISNTTFVFSLKSGFIVLKYSMCFFLHSSKVPSPSRIDNSSLIFLNSVIITFFVLVIQAFFSLSKISIDSSPITDSSFSSYIEVVAVFLPDNTNSTNLSLSIPKCHV